LKTKKTRQKLSNELEIGAKIESLHNPGQSIAGGVCLAASIPHSSAICDFFNTLQRNNAAFSMEIDRISDHCCTMMDAVSSFLELSCLKFEF
jgi:hypothetical protein